MRYFEFNKTDYYALVAVKPDKADSMIKAMKLYVAYVAYDSVYELRRESLHPEEVTKDHALLKFLAAPGNDDVTVGVLKKQFNECVDLPLLVDTALI